MSRGHNNKIFLVIISIVFIIGGLSSFVNSRDSYLVCDRAKNLCIIETKRVITGIKEEVQSIPIDMIKNAKIEKRTYNSSGRSRSSIHYRVKLVTKYSEITLFNETKRPNEQLSQINTYLASTNKKLEVQNNASSGRGEGVLMIVVGLFALILGNLTQRNTPGYSAKQVNSQIPKVQPSSGGVPRIMGVLFLGFGVGTAYMAIATHLWFLLFFTLIFFGAGIAGILGKLKTLEEFSSEERAEYGEDLQKIEDLQRVADYMRRRR